MQFTELIFVLFALLSLLYAAEGKHGLGVLDAPKKHMSVGQWNLVDSILKECGEPSTEFERKFIKQAEQEHLIELPSHTAIRDMWKVETELIRKLFFEYTKVRVGLHSATHDPQFYAPVLSKLFARYRYVPSVFYAYNSDLNADGEYDPLTFEEVESMLSTPHSSQ